MTISESKIANRNSKISLARNALQHLLVGREFLHEREQPLNGFTRLVAGQTATNQVNLLELPRLEEQFLAPRSRKENVHRGINALITDLAIEDHLHVTGAFELLENQLVHSAPSFDQGRGHDGERFVFYRFARRREKFP